MKLITRDDIVEEIQRVVSASEAASLGMGTIMFIEGIRDLHRDLDRHLDITKRGVVTVLKTSEDDLAQELGQSFIEGLVAGEGRYSNRVILMALYSITAYVFSELFTEELHASDQAVADSNSILASSYIWTIEVILSGLLDRSLSFNNLASILKRANITITGATDEPGTTNDSSLDNETGSRSRDASDPSEDPEDASSD